MTTENHAQDDASAAPDNGNTSEEQDGLLTGGDVDRRGFLRCMSWAGAGMLWTVSGGVPRSKLLGDDATPGVNDFTFTQISDSHIGFNKAANADVTATMRSAVAKIDALAVQPKFMIHTGDISQLAKPSEFDTADQVLRESRTKDVFFVPGEHDVGTDNAASYLQRYASRSLQRSSTGWYSFDHGGVHFIGLVNVLNLKAGGLGALGEEQLAWLERDVKHRSASTPIVVFAHVPLWTVYPEWGWGTDDGARALASLKRFGSVTVLNGHIHQTMQKVEGNVVFHTAMSTAFAQPRPGAAPAPGPMAVPSGRLGDVLGITSVRVLGGKSHLAVVDHTLSGNGAAAAMAAGEAQARAVGGAADAQSGGAVAGDAVKIANFAFAPKRLKVAVNARVTFTNADDVPHRIQSSTNAFAPSSVLDTGQRFTVSFARAGEYPYFCSIHPTMTGSIVVG